jgi:hypothetical protein
MPVDASIPLAAGQIQGPDPRTLMSLAEFAQAMRAQRQQQENRNALRSLFGNPASFDASGQVTPQATMGLAAIDPEMAMKINNDRMTNAMHQSTIDRNRAQASAAEIESHVRKQGFIQETVREPAMIAYDEAIQSGHTREAANDAAQRVYSEGLQRAKASGIFSEEEQGQFAPGFDHDRVRANSQRYKDYVAEQARQKKDASDARREDDRERHERVMEAQGDERERRLADAIDGQTKGWEIKEGVDKDGNPTFVRINKGTGEVQPVKGGVPNRKLNTATESERKAAMNYTTMKNAEDELEILATKDVKKLAFLSTIQRDENGYLSAADRTGRNRALTEDEQLIAQAALQFAEGAGHLKSGARINNETMGIITNLYVPMPGDSDAVIARKQAARRNDIEAARIGGGRAVEALDKAEKGQGDPGSAEDMSHLWSWRK